MQRASGPVLMSRAEGYDKVVQDLPFVQLCFRKSSSFPIFFENLSLFRTLGPTGDRSPSLRQNVVVSMPARHAGDLGLIPGLAMLYFRCINLALNIRD